MYKLFILLSLLPLVIVNADSGLVKKNKRLSFIEKEKIKLEKLIEKKDSSLELQNYLKEISNEEINIRNELAALKKQKKKKVTKNKKKLEKKLKKITRRKKRDHFKQNSEVMKTISINKQKPLKEQLTEVLTHLDNEERNLELLSEFDHRSRARKIASENVSYLSKEKERVLKSLRETKDKKKSDFDYHGHFQFRTENAENVRGEQSIRQTNQSFFRLRTYLTFSPNEKLKFHLTPQATKGFGEDNSAGNTTSGSTTHTELFFFEASINYELSENLHVEIGRQEVSYGDQLIIGALAWDNAGRSFDGVKFRYDHSHGWSDIMYSKVSDNSSTKKGSDDANLYTLYNAWSFGPELKNVDLYFLHQDDDRSGGAELNTIGFRLKGSSGRFFYRTENAIQNGMNVGDDAYQYNIELGSTFKSLKASFEYAVAGADYIQMYPTAHKFLGFADVLGRRNVKQMAFHLKSEIVDRLSLSAEYHIFKRNDVSQSAYKLLGSSWGSTGLSDDIGDELDIVLTYKTRDQLKYHLGFAYFRPGQYMKDQQNDDNDTRFVYGQVNASF